MSKKYVSVLKDSAATPGYRIIAPEDYVYTENGTKKVKKIDSKADKKVPATAGNLATLDSTGNLADSGKQTTDFMNALTTAYDASGSATKTVTKVTQAKTGAVTVTYSDIQSGTTSQKGLVQLEDSTSSTSTTKAATPNSVKSAYDLANGKYSKPSGGIPSSDMDSTVQASLGKADTAIQGVKLNGSTLTPSAAKVVDLGNLKTKQTAVSDPSASGTTITAIATISQDANGVITATKKTIQSASQSQDGVMSAADKTKLDGIATGAEVNQNAFSNVKVGDVTVAADAKTDTLTLAAGSNVTITPDATSDKITIAATDTTYTADAGIRLDGTVFKHTNSVSGGTVGPTTDTAGATLSVPYVTYDSQGHVTASGTRTHNVGTASTSGAGIVQLQDSIDATATKAATPNAVKKAIEALDVSSVGGSGKYISAISETDGKISATSTTMDTTPTASSEKAVTSGGIKTALDGKQNTLPTTGTASDTYAINVSGKAYQLRSIEVKSPQSDKCWAKIAETTNNTTTDYHIAFSVHNDGYAVKSAYIGILSASIQQSNQGTAGRYAVYFYRADAVEFDAIKAVLVNTGTVLELWVCNKRASQYIYFTPLHSLRLSPVYGQDRVYTQDEFDAYISGKSYYPSVEKGINRSGTDAVGSSSIPVWVDANGTLTQCTDDFVHDGDIMGGATSSAAGTSGLVPAPASGDQVQFLRGDGTWATPHDMFSDAVYSRSAQTGNGWFKIAESTSVSRSNSDITAVWDVTCSWGDGIYHEQVRLDVRYGGSGDGAVRTFTRHYDDSISNNLKFAIVVSGTGGSGNTQVQLWVALLRDWISVSIHQIAGSNWALGKYNSLWTYFSGKSGGSSKPVADAANHIQVIDSTDIKRINGTDVTSTYSATGTAPVNGTAVASAISTKSDKDNTVSICDGYAQGNVGKWYKIADTVVNGQNCDVTASFSIATSHYAYEGYYGKLMFSFRHDTSGRPPKRFVEIESSRGNTGKVQVYVVTRGAVTGDVTYEIWVSNILDVKAYVFIRLLQSAIKVNPAKNLWNFYKNATASDTAPQDDASTNTYRYLASELNWVKSVKIGSGSELKNASGNVSIPVDSTPTASSNNLMTSGAIKNALDTKADKANITGATKTKITYNSQGIVTAGADLAATDIPSLDAAKITSGTFGTARIADDAITAAKVKDNEKLPVNISGYADTRRSWEVKNELLYSTYGYTEGSVLGWVKILRIERINMGAWLSVKVRGYFYNENSNYCSQPDTRLHFLMISNFQGNSFTLLLDGIPGAADMLRAVKVSDTVVELQANYASTYKKYHTYYTIEASNSAWITVTRYSANTAATDSTPLFNTALDWQWNAWSYYSNYLLGTELTSSNNINDCKVEQPGGKRHYYWYSATKPSNTPTGSNSCFMECDGGVSANQTTQILHPMGNEKNTVYYWIRSYDGSSWSNWKTIYYEATSTYSPTGTQAVNGTAVASAISGKADKASVTAATKCKITYNSQGIVTAGADLANTDIPIGNKHDNVKAFETTLTPWLCYEITGMGLHADYKASTAEIMVFQYGTSGRSNLSYKISVHWTRTNASVEVEGSDIRGEWTAVVVNSATPESTDVTTLKLYCTPSSYTTFRLHIISCKIRGSTAPADGTITKKNVQEAIPAASELVIIGTTTVKTLLNTNDVTSTYSSTGTAPVNGTAVAAAINALDVTDISGFGTGKTLATLKEENGKISATFQNISITKSQVSDFSHTHGNIQNGGTLQTNDITIANGDKLVVTDSSDSSKVARTSISFDGSTTTQALTKAGTWATFNNYSLPLAASGTRGGIQIGYSESGTNYAVKLSSEKAYVTVPWTDTKVTQTADDSTNSGFELLFSGTADNTTRTEGARKSSKLKFNPSTGILGLGGTISRDLGSGVIAETDILYVSGSTDGLRLTYQAATSDAGVARLGSIDDANAKLSLGNWVSSTYMEAISIVGGTASVTGTLSGTATAANYLNYINSNEINFRNTPSSGSKHRVWFNYVNGDTNAVDADNPITEYRFGNRNHETTGVTLYADNFSGNAATASAAQSGSALETAINGKSNIYKWNAVTQGQKWSRIFYSESTAGVVGSSGILWIGCTRASVVCNAVFLVTAAHNGAERSNIVELSSCGYSELRCRLVVNSSANYYFEVYDTANSIASGTTQQWSCRYIPLRESKITTYTAFTDGTTIPSNYATCNDFTITVGNSAFAIKNITRSGTTFTATRQNGSTFTFSQQDSDTKNTAGSTDTSSKIFLVGATSQAANPQTYSQDTTYVDTDATLASTKVRVAEKCTLQFNTTTNALDFVFA